MSQVKASIQDRLKVWAAKASQVGNPTGSVGLVPQSFMDIKDIKVEIDAAAIRELRSSLELMTSLHDELKVLIDELEKLV